MHTGFASLSTGLGLAALRYSAATISVVKAALAGAVAPQTADNVRKHVSCAPEPPDHCIMLCMAFISACCNFAVRFFSCLLCHFKSSCMSSERLLRCPRCAIS